MFSTLEKAQIVRLVNGVAGNLHIALGTELATAIRENQDPPSLLKPGSQAVATASREVSQTLDLLMGQNNSAGFNDPKPPTREAALSSAWFHLDRCTMFIDQALQATALAGGVNTVRARTIWLPQAKNAIASIDRSLPYADPRPNTRGTLIGPHGDFDHSEWSIWRSWWYMLDALDGVIARYDAPEVDGYNFISKACGIAQIGAHGIARFGDIDVTAQEIENRAKLATLPAGEFGVQFWLLLAYGQVLTDFNIPTGVAGPQFYLQLIDALSRADGTFATERSKTGDSWRRMDSATWFGLLDFPGCDLTQDPAGCAAKLPSQQPCPPSNPVTSALTISDASVKKGGRLVRATFSGNPAKYTLSVDGLTLATNTSGVFTWNATVGAHTVKVASFTSTGSLIGEVSGGITVTNK